MSLFEVLCLSYTQKSRLDGLLSLFRGVRSSGVIVVVVVGF